MTASVAALLITVVIVVVPLISFLLITAAKSPSHHRQRCDGRRLPPSPAGGLPLLGHLHLLGRLPHRALRSMAASCGPVILLRLGQVPTVVASSAAAAEEVLKTRDLVFASRPRLLMADRLAYGSRDMIFAPSGERWRQIRRVCVVHLLSSRRVLGFRAARQQEVAALLARVRASGAAVNLSELLITYSNAVTSRATFGGGGGYSGLDGGDDDGGGKKLREVFAELQELLGTVPMAEMVPWLRLVDVVTGLERKARRVSEEMDRLLERVIADHRRRRGARRAGDGEDDRRDFVDVLLDLSEAGEDIGGVQLDTVTIKATILDMLIAGTDTSYTLMEWTMAELINHPTQMRKLQAEIRRAAGADAGGITEDDLPKLPYLKAVIKETLRLHPPGPLLVPRETLEDTELQGYHVPARTRVVINASAIGRDPAAWGEHAEEFMPEKFAAVDGDEPAMEYHKIGVDFRFLPFGGGRRGCPGIGFAVPAHEMALASLLYHFDWEVPAGEGKTTSLVDMSEVHGLSVRLKRPLILVATPWPR